MGHRLEITNNLCLGLGTIARGRFPEAEAAVAEGEEFFHSRAAGTVVDRFFASLAPARASTAPAPAPAPEPVQDGVVSER